MLMNMTTWHCTISAMQARNDDDNQPILSGLHSVSKNVNHCLAITLTHMNRF